MLQTSPCMVIDSTECILRPGKHEDNKADRTSIDCADKSERVITRANG